MASDLLFGGTPLLPAHFESDVAKAVFNEKGPQRRSAFQDATEMQILDWLTRASPKLIMRWSRQIDLLVVPVLSPRGFRQLCSYLCEHLPQAIENMPNARDSVVSLARAVHLSRIINPAALDRLTNALRQEGLAKN